MVEPEGPAIMGGDSNQDGVRLATPAASCCTSTSEQEKFCSDSVTEVYLAYTLYRGVPGRNIRVPSSYYCT